MRTLFLILFLALGSVALQAQVAFGCLTLDFETVPGSIPASGVVLSDQYKNTFGVTFRLEGGGFPVLAEVGPPTEAFGTAFGTGQDEPAPGVDIGRFFLTDDGILAGLESPPIILDFEIPIDTFAGCILDMDFGEVFTVQAMDASGAIILEEVITAGDPGTGDGALTCWGFNLPGCQGTISSIRYSGMRNTSGAFGLGMDGFSFCYTAAPLEAIVIPQTCNALGSVSILPLPGYTFSFNGGPFSDQVFWDNLPSGSYDIQVQDDEGCITEIPAFIVDLILPEIEEVTHENTICGEDNGMITVDAGTTAGPRFSLDGINFQDSNIFEDLPPDIYTVYVQDSFGCISIDGAIVEPSEPPSISLLTPTDDTCREFMGTIAVEAQGEGLQYSSDGINFQDDNLLTGLTEGDYEVFIRDEDGCLVSAVTSLGTTENVIIQDVTPFPAVCNESNGFLTVTATNGEGLFMYSMDGINYQADTTFTELPSGDYTVFVIDENGCTAESDVTIPQPDFAEILGVDEINTRCNNANGSIAVTSSLPSLTSYSLDGVNFFDSNIFENLEPGDYTIFIEDTNGCRSSTTASIAPSLPIDVEVEAIEIDSCDYGVGALIVTGTSENGQVSFSLNGGTPVTLGEFTELSGGRYNLYVSDELGCEENLEIDIPNTPGILIGSVDVITPECYEDNGQVEIFVSGGQGSLVSVLLDSIQAPNGFENLRPGSYELMVTDELGCLATRAVEVPFPYCPIYIPNVISFQETQPDDLFRIFTHPRYQAGVLEYRIYDRWGELVFVSGNFNIHEGNRYFWDGRFNGVKAEQDSYTYLIEVLHPNGFIESFAGPIMLMR